MCKACGREALLTWSAHRNYYYYYIPHSANECMLRHAVYKLRATGEERHHQQPTLPLIIRSLAVQHLEAL